MTKYLKQPGHPLAPPGGQLPRGRAVLYDKIGPDDPTCHWCEASLRWRAALSDVDRVVVCHLNHDGDDDAPANVEPSCHRCNNRHAHDHKFIGSLIKESARGTRTTAVQRTCDNCNVDFLVTKSLLKKANRGQFCSKACADEGQRQEKIVSRYRYVTKKGHPLSPPSGKMPAHRVILYDSIGPGAHPCHWCGTDVRWSTGRTAQGCLIVDHLDNIGTNNEISNLVPSCHACNLSRR